MPWYEDWFDRDEYELVYQERDDQEARRCVDLIERIVEPAAGADILDMGCGRGRHALELGRRGYHVRGVDLSERAITEAQAAARHEGLDEVAFEVGDMREKTCHSCFDGVVNLFTAFGYFEEDDDHQLAIDAFAEALRPGGWLVQDFLNVPHVCDTLVPHDSRVDDGTRIEQRRWVSGGRVNKEITLRRNGDSQKFTESVRLYDADDFAGMYERSGFTLAATYGDYDGRPHEEDSPRLILHAQYEGS